MDDSRDTTESDETDMIDLTNWEGSVTGDDTASHAMNGQHTLEDEVECEVLDVSEHNAEPWSSDENLLLAEGVALHTSRDPATRSVDWYLVAKHVRSRSVSECCFQWLQKVQAEVNTCIKKSWKQEEMDALLVAVAKQNSPSNYINWRLVAEQIPSRTPLQCCAGWFYAAYARGEVRKNDKQEFSSKERDEFEQPGHMQYTPWTLEDDALLLEAIDRHMVENRINWRAVTDFMSSTRAARHCMSRYNVLKPFISVKLGSWTSLEDGLLGGAVQSASKSGEATDWIEVARLLNCTRTALQCKERWDQICLAMKITSQNLVVQNEG